MATIKKASTATGHLVWGQSQAINPQVLIPTKPPKPPDPIPPQPQPPHPQPPQPPMATQIPLRTYDQKHFVCAELGGSPVGDVNATRTVQGPWETWTRLPQPDGRVVLQSVNGFFLSAELGGGGLVHANRTVIGPWEHWKEIPSLNGTAFQSDNGHFLCAEDGGGGPVNATRTLAGPWESFNLPLPPPPAGPVTRLHPDGHIFRDPNGQGWRYKGVSAFQLLDRYAKGEDITPFLKAYQGYNSLRVWPYVPLKDWGDTAWTSPPTSTLVQFVKDMNAASWYVELTLLTDNDPARVPVAKAQVAALQQAGVIGLFLEAANEPEVQHSGNIDTTVLKATLEQSGFNYASGNYVNVSTHYGNYLTTHTQRDSEWVRRCHDALDIYNPPADAPPGTPAKKMPIFLDEPPKLEDVSGDRVSDWKAYFAGSSFFGGGACFHSQTGKYAQVPTDAERQLAASALEGLNAWSVEAPLGPYSRVDDNTLRTYIVGNCMDRMRPTTPNAPQPGWMSMEPLHVLWNR
jgi:hypothetical protein